MIPLGLAVVPDVYSRYRSCSASIGSAGQSTLASAMRSWYQWSRPSTKSTSWPVRRTTTTSVIDGVASSAASTLTFSPDALPRRQPPSAVTATLASASLMRSMSESGENPPKTTEWAAPRRAQESMATGSSGIIGM